MQIVYIKGDFLFTIFPELANIDDTEIISVLEKYYTYNSIKPSVRIEANLVVIDIDTSKIFSQESDYNKVVALCEKGNYDTAKPILNKLIKENPTNSEYHRILGQILSEEGDQEEAINCLIDALRWDSKNNWALLMTGNIFSKFKNDIPTAMKFYDQALLANPNDYITINNIGVNLFQQGKFEEAKKYFWDALKINGTYPNTHFALGKIAEIENDLQSAFYSTIQAIKFNKSNDELFQNSVREVFNIAKRIIVTDEGKTIFQGYKRKLENEGKTEIDIIVDNQITTAAKFEFAEKYNRSKHVIKYNSSFPAIEHLVMHELVHYEFVLDARKQNANKLFVSNQINKSEFLKGIEQTILNLKKKGVSFDAISKYTNGLFEGMNLQIYNAPIDLFIENYLYNEYPELRPFQFISLNNLVNEALKSVTDKSVIEYTPKDILSKNRIYNIVSALQLKDLYGIDLINQFNANKNEFQQAKTFFEEFQEYNVDREAGEEYELLQHWADDLKLTHCFQLINEEDYQKNDPKRTELLNLYDRFQKSLENANDKEAETRIFLENQKNNGTNVDIIVYMIEALNYFEGLSIEKIKTIAFEIAMQGTNGYHPEGSGYKIDLIPNIEFSGYQILAYFYVSFALAVPEVLMELKLPYHEEYLLAKTMKDGHN
jgi:tetratricopeptide (TPR) repeat protein